MSDSNKVQYWVEISDYNIETAEAMLLTKRYLYVGFMCHKSVKKILKAYYTKLNNDIPPYTHNIIFLCKLTNIYDFLNDEMKNMLMEIEPLNIESRYPKYKEELSKYLNEEKCKTLLQNTREILQWFKKKL